MEKVWQLQEAKGKFSELVNQAIKEGPQIITRHGEEVVVVISIDEYTNLKKPADDLVEFFRASPLVEADLDLTRDLSPIRQEIDI
jgi:antitoxin Phd